MKASILGQVAEKCFPWTALLFFVLLGSTAISISIIGGDAVNGKVEGNRFFVFSEINGKVEGNRFFVFSEINGYVQVSAEIFFLGYILFVSALVSAVTFIINMFLYGTLILIPKAGKEK